MEVLWNNCLEEIEKQVLPENFNTWFTPTYPFSKDDKALTIAVPNRFYEKCLTENYLELIQNALETVSNTKLEVRFRVNSEVGGRTDAPKEAQEVAKTREVPPPTPLFNNGFLNPKYNFENFVVGPNNQFAHAAGQAVVGSPAYNYNPLFLYGAVGLGKTHLLHAIGNAIVKENPQARVRYISAESFTVDLIESIKKDRMQGFRERYRPLDVLLVDDIQFIAGKERTQEEFFYTFNTLYEYHKQIVISSDRYPKDMQNIEERSTVPVRERVDCGHHAAGSRNKNSDPVSESGNSQKRPSPRMSPCSWPIISKPISGNWKGCCYGSSPTDRSRVEKSILELAQEVLKDFTVRQKPTFHHTQYSKNRGPGFPTEGRGFEVQKTLPGHLSSPSNCHVYLSRIYPGIAPRNRSPVWRQRSHNRNFFLPQDFRFGQ